MHWTANWIKKNTSKGIGIGIGAESLSNPCITPDFIEKNPKRPWRWGQFGLSSNKFTSELVKEKKNKAARIIQIKFLDWFYKPVCKDGTFGLLAGSKVV
jgi:hypothetical protein